MDRDGFGKEFLGVGWKFPVQVDRTTGRIKTSAYEEDIREAIRIIIMTRKGERMMEPGFGCGVWDYVFDTMNLSSLSRMEQEIREALIRWEPRISERGCKIFCVYGNETFQIRIRYVVVFVGFCSRIFCRIYLSGYSISCPLSFIHAF